MCPLIQIQEELVVVITNVPVLRKESVDIQERIHEQIVEQTGFPAAAGQRN